MWADRIIDDGTDQERWLAAHRSRVTASDAQKLARPGSVDKYLKQKLAPRSFFGNEATESGHRWEPMMLAWAGIPQNLALVGSPADDGIAATVDGIGDRLAECKSKHGKVVDGPDVREWRQLALQFYCLPEFDTLEFIWVELDRDGEIRAGLHGEPKHLTIRRDDPRIIAATEQVLPVALDLLARLRVALSYERSAA